MTYNIRRLPPGSVTPDEITYSPYATAGDDFDASMMGAYEFAGAAPLFPLESQYTTMPMPQAQPARQQTRIMQMPSYAPPPGYKLVPLGGDSSTGMSAGKKVAIIVAAIVIIGAIIYYVRQNKGKTSPARITPTQAVKKLPTSRLAQNLYARLAKNGKASRSTLAALDKLSIES